MTEATRLKSRRHQEEVGARVDALRQRRVESEREREASLVLRGEVTPLLLVGRVAAAEDDELSALLEEPRRDGCEEVDAFLLDEAADDPEDGSGRVDRKPRLLLKRGLADRLTAVVVRVVARRDLRIVRGV